MVANPAMTSYIEPLLTALGALAGVATAFFIVWAGLDYLTSRGQPDKLARAKQTLVRSFIGLGLILAAAAIVSLISQEAGPPPVPTTISWPDPVLAEPDQATGLVGLVLEAIVGVGLNIIGGLGRPLVDLLDYLSQQTPLVGQQPGLVRIWLAVLGLANSLFVLVVVLIGFHIMSATSLGLGSVSFRQILPRLALAILAINLSLVLIDLVIGLSNALVFSLHSSLPTADFWSLVAGVGVSGGDSPGLLLLSFIGLVLAAALVVYYLMRLVVIYLGAVMAPLIILVGLLPGWREFSYMAARAYIATIFIVFIHGLILAVAGSLVAGLPETDSGLLEILLTIGVLLILLKTPAVLARFNYATVGPRFLRQMGNHFSAGLSHISRSRNHPDGGGFHG